MGKIFFFFDRHDLVMGVSDSFSILYYKIPKDVSKQICMNRIVINNECNKQKYVQTKILNAVGNVYFWERKRRCFLPGEFWKLHVFRIQYGLQKCYKI